MMLENLTKKARNSIGLPKLTITAESFAVNHTQFNSSNRVARVMFRREPASDSIALRS